MMIRAKTWTADVLLTEDDGKTRAEAILRLGADRELRGIGLARRNPRDREVPEIGDEVAVARAFSDLAHHLLEVAAEDIQTITHEPAHLRA